METPVPNEPPVSKSVLTVPMRNGNAKNWDDVVKVFEKFLPYL